MKKIDWLILFSIIFISIVVLKDLFKQGMYTSHDGIHQVVRFYYFDQALRDGQIPPRWVQGLLNGFGYPLFIFSYHFPWFIAEIIHIFGFSIIDSVKLTFLVGFMLSGVTMYLVQKDIFGRLPAIVGTTLYLFAPFRFSNIFVRAAIGDATAFIFAPLVFWVVWKLKYGWNWNWVSIGSIGIAGLILSHAMVAVLFMSVFILYILFYLPWVKKGWDFLKSCSATFILGFGISAYYLIPSIAERSNTQFQNLMSNIFIGSYFPSISDLIYSKWGYGVFHAQEGAMSVQLGIVGWGIIILMIILLLIYSVKKKLKKNEKPILNDGKIFIFLFFISIFMMLPVSLPIWKWISQTVFIDFPWRILAVSVFLVSLCAGLVVSLSGRFKTVLAILLILSAIYFNRNHVHINQSLPWDLAFILKLEKTTNTHDEYTPRWVKPELVKENAPTVEISDLKSTFSINKKTSNKLDLSIDSPAGGNVYVNTIYYPGWSAYINGRKVQINFENTGLIQFPVSSGMTSVILKFEDTPLRKLGNIISLISIGLLFIPFLKYKKI